MKYSEQLNFNILEMSRIKRTPQTLVTENKACFVLSCRLSGESSFFYNNKIYKVKKGDVLYIPSGLSYTQSNKNEDLICFHLEIFGPTPNEICVFTPEDPDEICLYFKNAYYHWKKKTNNHTYFCLSELYKIVAVTDLFSYNTDDINERLAPALSYINAHLYDSDLSFDEACKKAAISRIYFNKLFRQQFNMPPTKYVNKLRIKKAKILLKSGIYTREEIAKQCGFNDVKYFYTVFKNITGLTTGKYITNQG